MHYLHTPCLLLAIHMMNNPMNQNRVHQPTSNSVPDDHCVLIHCYYAIFWHSKARWLVLFVDSMHSNYIPSSNSLFCVMGQLWCNLWQDLLCNLWGNLWGNYAKVQGLSGAFLRFGNQWVYGINLTRVSSRVSYMCILNKQRIALILWRVLHAGQSSCIL